MKRFIKKIILFSVTLIVILFLVQGLVSLRIKGKTVRGHDNLEITSNVNADLVLLGSSRCWAHFDPVFFDTTYHLKSVNIGVDGHIEIVTAMLRLQNYLAKNKPPKYAILSFDAFMVAGDEDNNQNFVHKDAFARYSFFPNTKDLTFVNYFKFDWAEKYIPLYSIFKNQLFIDCLTLKNSGNYPKYGFDKHVEQWDTIKIPISSILKKPLLTGKNKPYTTLALEKLNQFCIKNNIQLLCIQTPVYKAIADKKSFSIPSEICKKLNIPFLDVNKNSIQENISYFYNSNHLNNKGVERMNSYLKNNLQLANFLKSNKNTK